MWRPAVSRFGAIGFATVFASLSCWSGKTDSTRLPTNLEPGARDITGPYWCSIDDEDYTGPRYACSIKNVRGKLMLAKLGGQERIRGFVLFDEGEGFAFVGELYCAWGDCAEQIRGRFVPHGKGGYKGVLNGPLDHRDSSLIVYLTPAPANAFGGNAYGGDRYGDPFVMGGASYGGAGYGYYRIDRRGRRRP